MREPAQRTTSARNHRARRRRLGWLAALGAVAAPAAARAQTAAPPRVPTVCIEWRTPTDSTCATRAALVSKVEDVLGRPMNTSDPCDEIVEGNIERTVGAVGYTARLTIRTGDGSALGSRELTSESPTCSALTDPTALVVALIIENAKPHVRLHVEPPLIRPVLPKDSGPTWRASSGLSMVSGLLNAMAMGPELRFAALLGHRVSLGLDGGAWVPLSAADGRSGRFWAALGGARLCIEDLSREPRIALCGGARSGVLHGSGVGLDYNLSTSRPYTEAHVELSSSFPLYRSLSLLALGAVGVPFARPRFVYLETDASHREVHRPAAVVSYVGLGVELSVNPQRVAQ